MTHNARVLELLSDGRPHSHNELYGLHVVAHSRVSDLRKQGHRIDAWRDGDQYLYQLVPLVEGSSSPAAATDPPSNGAQQRHGGGEGEPSTGSTTFPGSPQGGPGGFASPAVLVAAAGRDAKAAGEDGSPTQGERAPSFPVEQLSLLGAHA